MYGIDPANAARPGRWSGGWSWSISQWIDGEAFRGRSREHLAAGFFAPPLYGWVLANPQAFAEPVPWRGRPGLFEVADGVLQGRHDG